MIASSDFCPYAAYAIGDQVLCFQGHPEFVHDYSRELLELRVWRGLDYDAIGDRLDVAPDAARMRVNRALGKLAKAVEALKAPRR